MIKIFDKLVFGQNEDKLKKLTIKEVIYDFENKKNKNLFFLIEKRFEWMKRFINENEKGLEVGAGAGFSKVILNSYKIDTCDYSTDDHLDFKDVDAMNTKFEKNSYDYVIASNMMHHVSYPVKFINEMNRILKKNGKLIIFEPNLSIIYQLITLITKHEGFDFNYNIWESTQPMNKPDDLWDSNQAAAHLLFDNKERFSKNTNNIFEIIHDEYSEFLIFINSGGIYSKSKYIPLNYLFLRFFWLLDKILTKVFPNIFALGRQIVLKKN
tara:strand:+ start:10576 stop:11379 length:804 start_codon:yes stop_codon:yes gene_type:complete